MVNFVKQDMTNIWAELGDYVAPDSSKITQGWLVEVVPRQYWNWIENRQDKMLAYLSQKGIPEWDSVTEYIINKSYVQHNNVVYKCIQTGTNKDPSTQTAYWKKAFTESNAISDAVVGLTPDADKYVYFTGATTATLGTITSFARSILDDTSASSVRTTIGAQQADATLTALAGVASDTNKLPYFTGVDVAAVTDLTAFGRSLIDDATATDARTTLGLGTAATANVTTVFNDTTAGRVLKVGDFGLGALNTTLVADCNTATAAGFYTVSGTATNRPAGLTSANANMVVTVGGISDRCTQVFSLDSGSTPRLWVRNKTGASTFSEWFEISKVGDYGIGGIGITAPSDNLNLVTAGGIYVVNGATANKPSTAESGSTCLHLQYNTDNASQVVVARELNGSRTWTRDKRAGEWGQWDSSLTTRDVQNNVNDNTPGAILAVGAFGLGSVSMTDIGSMSLDLLASSPTQYCKVTASNAASCNAPSGAGGGVVQHMSFASNFAVQIYTQIASTNRMWFRRCVGTWSAWSEIVSSKSATEFTSATLTGGGQALTLKGTATGASNVAVVGFEDSAGTRIGYVGDAGSGTSNITIGSDTGDIGLIPGGNFVRVVGNLDVSGIVTSVGVTDGSNAVAGDVGEVITATRTTAATQSNNVVRTVTQITLTPGDWEVDGQVTFGGTSTDTFIKMASISLAAATIDPDYSTIINGAATNTSIVNHALPTPTRRVNITANTTVYLTSNALFSTGTQTVVGRIQARRIR